MKERRRYSREFKLEALRRMETAPHVEALARELGVGREMLYVWRRKYALGGAGALTTSGRPVPRRCRSKRRRGAIDEVSSGRRIAELERKVGQQALELDFFRQALRHVREPRSASDAPGETGSTR